MKKCVFLLVTVLLLMSCAQQYEHKTVVCIPVYGQSLALGEEAERITDFDSLAAVGGGRIVTENLDYQYGFFDNNRQKQWVKKLVKYTKRSFELSLYGMAESLAVQLGQDTVVCIFPGGQGATAISNLNKGTAPYNRFMDDITAACNQSKDRGWDFYVPAVCWMQGESDLFDYTDVDYKQLLMQFSRDINADIKRVTGQSADVRMVCYQTNLITNGKHYQPDAYDCQEVSVPQAMMELVRDDSLFVASGPTYPYSFARELKHIDGLSQKRFGYLEALSALNVIRGVPPLKGVVPVDYDVDDRCVTVTFHVPCPPLVVDTVCVRKVANYGFSVITPDNVDICDSVTLADNAVRLHCSSSPAGCRVRYAVNGERMKSGWEKGPRGNLRDSQGDDHKAQIQGKTYPLHNWCYQFELKEK